MFSRNLLIAIFVGVTMLGVAAAAVEYQALGPSIDLLTGARLYRVTFHQLPMCGGESGWGAAWAVTLDGQVKTQPPNATVDPSGLYGTSDISLSTISFYVPNGTHHYRISPDMFSQAAGVVTVNGSDVVVQTIELTSCPSMSSTTG